MPYFDLIAALVTFFVIFFGYYQWAYQYWRRKNLPYVKPQIPFGNINGPIGKKENDGITFKKLYDQMREKKWKHGGIFVISAPTYLVTDLDYLKNIMTKDFHHFVDRGFYHNEKDDPLSAHLFAVGGTKWKNLRIKLTPTFTSGKMKMMFDTLLNCEPNLLRKIDMSKDEAIDIKEILACFTTDIIGSCAFGLDFKTFEDENAPFRMYGRKLVNGTPLRAIRRTIATAFPDLARSLGVKSVPTDIANFFMKVVKETVDYREKNNYARKDFMQLLVDAKNNKLAEALTIEEIAAQSFVFFIAGFETSSTTMSFALYELARHQDMQQKLREEIDTVLAKHGGKITYEAIQEMKYMNQVIDETLRKYPPVPFLTRVCVEDYKVPDEDLVIEKGTSVLISILGIHHDAEYYPDPEKFDPERFSEENKNSRHRYAHIPFGEGPRICIGLRFGLMQSKVGLASLLGRYRFTVNQKTKEPLTMKLNSFVLAADGEIWLDAHKI